jgi:hypothetical protein
MAIKKFIKLCQAITDKILFSLFDPKGLKWRL